MLNGLAASSGLVEQQRAGLQLHLLDQLGLLFQPSLRRLRLVQPLAFTVCSRVRTRSAMCFV